MKGKRLVGAVGGAGILFGLGLLVYVISGLIAGQPDRPVFSSEWVLCDEGDMCVAVAAPCGEWQPVNRAHEEAAAAYYGHLITVVEEAEMMCMSTNLSMRKPAAYCRSGVCEPAR
ncbi:MAG: hypothetical protein OEN55_08950 [Alphaproteobacteria bacterium]|nr:hypothetical protein [Alphaproteobacteria bacterium]